MDFPFFQLHGWGKQSGIPPKRLIQRFPSLFKIENVLSIPFRRHWIRKASNCGTYNPQSTADQNAKDRAAFHACGCSYGRYDADQSRKKESDKKQ